MRPIEPGDRQVHREIQAVGHAPVARRVQRLGVRPADADPIRRRRVARRHRRGNHEPQRAALDVQLADIGDLQQHFLARRQVADARLEDIRPLLVEQVCAMARLHPVVVLREGRLAFHRLTDDQRAVDQSFETADGRALVEREHVHRLDRPRLAVDEPLRDRDARAEVDDVGDDRDAGQRHGDIGGGEQARARGNRQCVRHRLPRCWVTTVQMETAPGRKFLQAGRRRKAHVARDVQLDAGRDVDAPPHFARQRRRDGGDRIRLWARPRRRAPVECRPASARLPAAPSPGAAGPGVSRL